MTIKNEFNEYERKPGFKKGEKVVCYNLKNRKIFKAEIDSIIKGKDEHLKNITIFNYKVKYIDEEIKKEVIYQTTNDDTLITIRKELDEKKLKVKFEEIFIYMIEKIMEANKKADIEIQHIIYTGC